MRYFALLILVLCFPLMAVAQTYPSPTFNALTLQSPLSIANGGTGSTIATGSGSVVLATSPTITTPNVVGVSNGSSAGVGSLGEYVSVSASSVTLTNGAYTNVAVMNLSAGDWDVTGGFRVTNSTGTLNNIAAGATTISQTAGPLGTTAQLLITSIIGGFSGAIPAQRFLLSAPTTVYLIEYASATSGTSYGAGYIQARRVH